MGENAVVVVKNDWENRAFPLGIPSALREQQTFCLPIFDRLFSICQFTKLKAVIPGTAALRMALRGCALRMQIIDERVSFVAVLANPRCV